MRFIGGKTLIIPYILELIKEKTIEVKSIENPTANWHHVDNKLPIDKINKVNNLAWVCRSCHLMIHGSEILESLDTKVVKKIEKFREKLKQAQK